MVDVLVVGGGPVGLLLAAELKLAGVEPLVLEAARGSERRERSFGMRGINARSTQTLRLRGLTAALAAAQKAMFDGIAAHDRASADLVGHLVRMLQEGRARGHFGGLPLVEDEGVLDGSAEQFLLKQHLVEAVLAERARELDVDVRPGCEVVDVLDEDGAVVAVLADGRRWDAEFLVGCDGGRSVVRKRSGIAFPGTPATMTGRSAVAELADPDAITSSLHSAGGLVNLSLVPGEIATIEFDGGPGDRDTPVTAEEMQASIRRASGTDAIVTRLESGIRYSDNTRLADVYRQGRILLAGDAAHVHSPIGGQGLNLGLQDAVNLGWKLALVIRGLAPERLLDTYTAERRPVAERVLRNTRAQVALMRPGPQTSALREVLGETLQIPEAKRHFTEMINHTDIDYAPDSAHPLTGRFVPALEPDALRDGRALLIAPGAGAEIRSAAAGFADRVRVHDELSGSPDGRVTLLVRPDGYVAFAGVEPDPAELTAALTAWFGTASAAAAVS
ncbi:FAD-dependent monooxygenase [Pseudonocardia sp. GCM10023141]|uniref:FAD-dependent monooxygenase n=1 Tax=Pseudonocardia sp. GCM10023141 TaxID=3252653 RepID=UPI00361EE5B1